MNFDVCPNGTTSRLNALHTRRTTANLLVKCRLQRDGSGSVRASRLSENSRRRSAPKKRARVYDVVFAYALPNSHPNGGVVFVDLCREGPSYLGIGAPVWRDVHRSLDLYFSHHIASVLAACKVKACQQRVRHGGDDQRPDCHRLLDPVDSSPASCSTRRSELPSGRAILLLAVFGVWRHLRRTFLAKARAIVAG